MCVLMESSQGVSLGWFQSELKRTTVAQWSKLLQMKASFAFLLGTNFPEPGGRLEKHTIHSEVQCKISAVCRVPRHLLGMQVGPFCFIKSKVNAAVYLMPPSALWRCRFPYLAPAHSAKTATKQFPD